MICAAETAETSLHRAPAALDVELRERFRDCSLHECGFLVADVLLFEAGFGALHGFLGGFLVDGFLGERHVHEDADFFSGDFDEPFADGEVRLFAAFGDDEFARLDRGDERAVRSEFPVSSVCGGSGRACLGLRLVFELGRCAFLRADVITPAEIDAEPQHVRTAAHCRQMIITRGGDPTLIITASGILRIAPPQVTPVDTVGAGGAFTGAFAVAYASGMPLEEAIRFANAAGALATQGRGAQTSTPGRDAILALVGRRSAETV